MSAERWTYAGRRETVSGGLGVLWLDADGAELLFKLAGGGHRAVGARYDVDVTRGDDGAFEGAGLKGARFVEGPDHDDARVAGWEADDRAAYVADEARKAEARVKRDGVERFGDLTLNDLRAKLAAAPRPQRTALLASALAHLGA